MLAADVALLADLDTQIAAAEAELAALVPRSPFATLTSVPGWGVVRVANYAAALGDPARWPGPRQIYRAAGLSPMQYESAGKRRDGTISREGSVALRRALIDLGIGSVADRPGRQSLCRRPESPRQARRHHRLRPGASRHPHRLCAGARPRHLRPVPLDLNTAGVSSVRAIGAGTQELSTCSARSAARTNDVDSDEHRRTLTRRGNASHPPARKAPTNSTFTTPVGGARLERNEGPDQMPTGLWRTDRLRRF